MTIFAGLDVSDKTTHICVVDGDGAALRRNMVAGDPENNGNIILINP
jgi:transposase